MRRRDLLARRRIALALGARRLGRRRARRRQDRAQGLRRAPGGYPTVGRGRALGKKLEPATNGRLSVQMYASMQLGGEKEAIEQAQVGAIQLARVSVGALGPVVDDLNVFNLPFLFRDTAHMRKVIDGPIGQELLDKVTNNPTRQPRRPVLDGCRRAQHLRHQEADQEHRRPEGPEDPRHRQPDVRRHDERARRQRRGDGLRPGVQRAADRRRSTAPRTTRRASSSTTTTRWRSTTPSAEHLIVPEMLVFSKQGLGHAVGGRPGAGEEVRARGAARRARAVEDKKEADASTRHEGGRHRDRPRSPTRSRSRTRSSRCGTSTAPKYADMIKRIQAVTVRHGVMRPSTGTRCSMECDCYWLCEALRSVVTSAIRGDGCALCSARWSPGGAGADHRGHAVGRLHPLRAQQRRVLARADGDPADDRADLFRRGGVLPRRRAHARTVFARPAAARAAARGRLARRGAGGRGRAVHGRLGHAARRRRPGTVDRRVPVRCRSASPICRSRSAAHDAAVRRRAR